MEVNINEESKNNPKGFSSVFYFYCLIIFVVYVIAFKEILSISSPENPNYPLINDLLGSGWLFNRKIDNSDFQYSSFRNNVPILLLVSFSYLIISWTIKYFKRNMWTFFSFISSLIFLFVLHGFSIIKILLILSINYHISKSGHKYTILFIWIFSILTLFLNEKFRGYSFSNISDSFVFLDKYKGMMPNWKVHFNMTFLRMISFGMDYCWASPETEKSVRSAHRDCEECKYGKCEKLLSSLPRNRDEYTFVNYIAYTLYIPLYLAGPIISFNNFRYQMSSSKPSFTIIYVITYFLRWIICFLIMEIMMHCCYLVAITKLKVISFS